jgi:hypothetical protein
VAYEYYFGTPCFAPGYYRLMVHSFSNVHFPKQLLEQVKSLDGS